MNEPDELCVEPEEAPTDEYEPTPEELDEWYRSIAEPDGGAL